MKLVVPMLAEAWSGQLLASGLPFYELNRVSVPFVEILVGIALGFGLFTRPAAVMVIGIMAVATYSTSSSKIPRSSRCSQANRSFR